jgi:hypothetical protein
MARPKRFFFTGPARLIGDSRPTALDLRCLAVIAFHDGMSGVSGKGGGCYAKNATLAAMVGTDVSNFSKSLSRLLAWGYIAREPQLMDKRRFTLRVVYDDDDSWRTDQPSPSEIVGEDAQPEPEIVGDAEGKNGSFSTENGTHYISLNEELDFDESRKLNSAKRRDFGFSKRDGAEAPAARGLSIAAWLNEHSPRFSNLDTPAQLCRFEEAFNALGADADNLDSRDRSAWTEWLYALSDEFGGDPLGYHAQRLYEEMIPF